VRTVGRKESSQNVSATLPPLATLLVLQLHLAVAQSSNLETIVSLNTAKKRGDESCNNGKIATDVRDNVTYVIEASGSTQIIVSVLPSTPEVV
jgi:hypothetical protein